MQAIKNKIRSQRGASLTFALLLFLVCAVVGSVVLTAGTAAAGRMSQIAEMDQRYYSVNSAARLLIELMENYEIRYEKKESANPTADGDGDTSGDSATEYNYLVNGKAENEVTDKPYKLALYTTTQILKLKDSDVAESASLSLNLNPTEPSIEGAKLNVKITGKISKNGDLEFNIKSADSTTQYYTITLRFMNVGGSSSYKWKLYDIESTMPAASSAGTGGGD